METHFLTIITDNSKAFSLFYSILYYTILYHSISWGIVIRLRIMLKAVQQQQCEEQEQQLQEDLQEL